MDQHHATTIDLKIAVYCKEKVSFRRKSSRATAMQALILLRVKKKYIIKKETLKENYPHLCSLLRFLNKIFVLILD